MNEEDVLDALRKGAILKFSNCGEVTVLALDDLPPAARLSGVRGGEGRDGCGFSPAKTVTRQSPWSSRRRPRSCGARRPRSARVADEAQVTFPLLPNRTKEMTEQA
jgi:hypothetical protein